MIHGFIPESGNPFEFSIHLSIISDISLQRSHVVIKQLLEKLRQWRSPEELSTADLRQVGGDLSENGLIRRSYASDYFDLFIWLDDQDQVIEFQLCYDKMGKERVLTWNQHGTITHRKVDAGKQQRQMTSIYTPDGALPKSEVRSRFQQNSRALDQRLAEFIIDKIESYSGPELS